MKKGILWLRVAAVIFCIGVLVCFLCMGVHIFGTAKPVEDILPWARAAAVLWALFCVCLLVQALLSTVHTKSQDRSARKFHEQEVDDLMAQNRALHERVTELEKKLRDR